MEELHSSRRSSGLYEGIHASSPSIGNDVAASNASLANESSASASLARNTVPPAGFSQVERTTPAGVVVAGSAPSGENATTDGATADAAATTTTPAQSKIPWYKRKSFLISQAIIIPLGIVLLFVMLFPVVTAIVQLVVNRSTLNVDVAAISSPQNDSFQLQLDGYVAHTGIIAATIDFTEPITVSWVEDNGNVTFIGSMSLSTLHASHKRAYINQTTSFSISDEEAFGRFAAYMITSPQFTWRLQSDNLKAQALKFPVSHGIKFNKDLTLNGFDSFSNQVTLDDFQLPSDNPAGGIDFVAVTGLNNPSPFQLNLGTVVFSLSYSGLNLGIGTGTNTIIKPQSNQITLTGTLVSHNDSDTELATMSELFTNYINGWESQVIATGVSTLQSDGSAISWLSQGLQALQLNVPFKPATGAINPIKTIDIGNFGLQFFESSAWTPSAESQSVQATMELPFGFNLVITDISNDFNISKNGLTVAGLQTPSNASTSSISVVNSTFTQGTIDIIIADTNLSSPDPDHPTFSQFNANLTNLDSLEFQLAGQSRAVTELSIGTITLDPIMVNVTTSLLGLQGLDGYTTINSVDVTGGIEEGILLDIGVSIYNPSNLILQTGNLSLELYQGSGLLGAALIPNLNLKMGNNSVNASSVFNPNGSPEGLQTLDNFVGHQDVNIDITGYNSSTNISSLLEAFQTLRIGATLPALQTELLDSAALEILPTTGKTNNITHVTVSIANPWSAALQITNIQSTVSYMGINLGTIDTSTNFSSEGKSTSTSPELDLNLNFDPEALFTVTRALAVKAGLDVAPLDGIVALGGYQYLSTTGPDTSNGRRDNIYTGFDLPTFVLAAFKELQSDVELSTDVTIGDYSTVINYNQSGLPTKTDDSLTLILPILAQPIVQKIVSGTGIGIDTVTITDPTQTSFGTKLKGNISNAGPFDAVISFGQGLTVSWGGQPLGTMKMDDVNIIGDVGADLDLTSTFEVADADHLTEFTKTLLTEESFEWDISAENLTISALGISVSEISLPSKSVTLKGFNGLKNGVQILTFDLPSDDPDGGIHLTLEASTTNPSQVGIELSSIGFETYVGDVMIAPVVSDGGITLSPQSSTNLSLTGRLVPQSTDEGLATVSDVFNKFIHGEDSPIVVHGASAGPSDVSWLNDGIKALQVDSVLPNQGPLNIIQSISLNQMTLMFSDDAAYSPLSGSNSTDAKFEIPFAFPLDVISLSQTIDVSYDGAAIAQLVIPEGPSTTDVDARIIHLTFQNVPFAVLDNAHDAFDNFVAQTTVGGTQDLGLSGAANTQAQTAVGLLTLTNITFDVGSSIDGLQGLKTEPTTVANLDVNHGYSDYLLITVDSSIFNPSNLTIGTGDVSFSLIFQDKILGTADISNMIITPGNQSYATDVHFSPGGDAEHAGQTLLENYIQGVDSDTTIAGSNDSTSIESLQLALSEVILTPVTIPAMHDTLVKSASLSFPTDIVQTGVAEASFTLANPFTASINLLTVSTTALYQDLELGVINDVDVSSNPIHADGHSNVTSQNLPMNYNLDPVTIIKFLTLAAQANNVDMGPLTDMFQFVLDNPDFKPPVNTSVDSEDATCISGNQFDIDGAILAALENLRVDLSIDSSLKLDDYATSLAFNQTSIPIITDDTALYLIGAVGGPIAQNLVDGAILSFTAANITNITNEGFDLSLEGSLTNAGPLDALITFTEPVVVTWQDRDIATIELPPVCVSANSGVPDYRPSAHLTISDTSMFTDFSTYLLHNPSFDWTISTPTLRLTALGTIFDNVSLSKNITFKAFNNLPGVTISNFELPSDDPAGGIHIETDALIPSPSQLGIDLGTVGFNAYFNNLLIGPLTGDNLFLAANAETTTHLTGRMVPQSGSDLDTIGVLFSAFLAGENQTLVTKGDSVQPDGSSGPVTWLSDAFQTLSLNVILPGQKFEIIQSITLGDLAVTMVDQAQTLAPPSTSNSTLATYKNPFGFSLQVLESGQDITLSNSGVDIAQLSIPKIPVDAGVSTGNIADLDISWENEPLVAINDNAFAAMLAAVTNQNSFILGLNGNANVTAQTSIGDIPISGIPFSVQSTLTGITDFGGVASLSNVTIQGSGGDGGSEYIMSSLSTTLQNPSNISLSTVDTALPVFYQSVMIGRASIDPFNLVPGENTMATDFHYQPDNANDTIAQEFLNLFITTDDTLALSIQGDAASTPFTSLQAAFTAVKLSTALTGLNQPTFITQINVLITLDTLVTNLVSINFDITNPLTASITIEHVQSDSGVDGTIYAQFGQSFEGFTIEPGQTVNSGTFGNVLLTQGAIASLDIIPLGILDVDTANTLLVGDNGYQIPWLHLNQVSVPTAYDLDLLSISEMKEKAESLSASSVAATATTSNTEEKSGSVTLTGASQGTSTTAQESSTIDSTTVSESQKSVVSTQSPQTSAAAVTTSVTENGSDEISTSSPTSGISLLPTL